MKQNQKRRIKCLLAAFCLSLGLLGAATASAFEAETVEPISEAPVVQDKENTALQSASLLSADTGILYGRIIKCQFQLCVIHINLTILNLHSFPGQANNPPNVSRTVF